MKMKVCTMLVFCGILLAAVISANSHPVEDVSTAKTTSVTSKDGTSSANVPPPVSPLFGSASSLSATNVNPSATVSPPVSPLFGSASSLSATNVNPPDPLGSSESESKESEEQKSSSTTARSLFRRQADDQSESDDGDDGDDNGDDGEDEETDSSETRSRRQLSSSQSDLKGELSGQGKYPEYQKKDDQQTPEKPPPLASQPKY